ncbi:MAG: DNA recombination protein RmuC, partial [Muribaculaceae bacterium]|nr:DNA recombination protein RmuC [Muribaculaceae bacterium]
MKKASYAEETKSEESRIKILEQHIDLLQRQILQQSEEMRRQSDSFRQQTLELRKQTKLEFESLSNEALSFQKKQLMEEGERQMTGLLSPLKSKLEDFNKVVTDSYVKENASRQSLADQIERLMKLNTSIGEEARNLTKALKGNSKVQGDWGETILESLLEQAGLKRNINFFVQASTDGGQVLRDDDNRLRRPDIIVNLPENRKVIIDSKVSLTAYIDIIEAEDNETRKKAEHRLIESVKKHVVELADKRYQKLVKNSADHILMFMPNEGAWITAMNIEPGLWEFSFKRNVIIVCPTHLFSVIQLIVQLWQKDKQNRNAEEIARLGG